MTRIVFNINSIAKPMKSVPYYLKGYLYKGSIFSLLMHFYNLSWRHFNISTIYLPNYACC